MRNVLRLLHLAGLAAFLGSILTYIVITEALRGAEPAAYAFARRAITLGTYYLTVPGMWLVIFTGAAMALKEMALLNTRWVRIKVFTAFVIALNAHFMVLPAVNGALSAALASVDKGAMSVEYHNYYLQESIFGALNVVLIFVAAAAGVWKFRGKAAKAAPRLRAIS